MAAAPNLPMPDAAVTRTISIDDTFTPTPQGLIVNPGDTVMFQNNSGVEITIQFAPNYTSPALSSNLDIPDGDEAGFVAPATAAAANYGIYVGATQESGPWAIQVGAGPMYVVLTGSGTCNFPTVAVPLGNILTGFGKLSIGPNATSGSLGIGFQTNPFNPPITTNDGSHPVKAGTDPGSYSYTVVDPDNNPGPGKVIIRSA